jgi:hypothetical protein
MTKTKSPKNLITPLTGAAVCTSAKTKSPEAWRRLELDRLDAVVATWLSVSRDSAHPEAARGAAIVIRAIETQARLLGLLQRSVVPPASEKPVESESMKDTLRESPALMDALERELAKAKNSMQSPDHAFTVK